jgi:hypothetical protein
MDIKTRNNQNTNINQVGGNQTIFIQKISSPSFPIYLTYADSDVQALCLNHAKGISVRKYVEELSLVVRLLICFKPLDIPLCVAPSSLVQSEITREVLLPFLELDERERAMVQLLRREADWGDYFAKRQNNVKDFRHKEIYSGYYDSALIRNLSKLDATRKRYFSGSETIKNWAERINSHPNSRQSSDALLDLAGELLEAKAFVYETSLEALNKIEMLDGSLSLEEARAFLVDSYLDSVVKDCAIPTSIALRWDPCPASTWGDREVYNMRTLEIFAKKYSVGGRSLWNLIVNKSPSELLRFASSDCISEIRQYLRGQL